MAKILELSADEEKKLVQVGKALSSVTRIDILKLLYYKSYNVGEIATALDIPASSASLHIRTLEEADLIITEQQPGNRGSMKLCSRKHDLINIRLVGQQQDVDRIKTIEMPIGHYTDCSVFPTCGIASEKGIIGFEDQPSNFHLPERVNAQLFWSSGGYVEYKFPNPLKDILTAKRIILSFEACSEAPNYHEQWQSDITIWINGVECVTWRCPGDFGARRGRLNPSWWDSGATQYGLLTSVEITNKHSLLNSKESSDISIKDLSLKDDSAITVRIGNKDDAEYRGGFNLFGSKFGDYEQNLLLSVVY